VLDDRAAGRGRNQHTRSQGGIGQSPGIGVYDNFLALQLTRGSANRGPLSPRYGRKAAAWCGLSHKEGRCPNGPATTRSCQETRIQLTEAITPRSPAGRRSRRKKRKDLAGPAASEALVPGPSPVVCAIAASTAVVKIQRFGTNGWNASVVLAAAVISATPPISIFQGHSAGRPAQEEAVFRQNG